MMDAVGGTSGTGGASENDLIAAGRENVAQLNAAQIQAGKVQTEFAKSQIARTVVQSSAQR